LPSTASKRSRQDSRSRGRPFSPPTTARCCCHPARRRRWTISATHTSRWPNRRQPMPPDANIHPARLEVFKQLFQAVAEEMGEVLMRTGYSPNIKERRDYSCALFDAQGETIVQAEHLPVHL